MTSHARTWLQAILTTLPIAALASLIACHGIDIPLNDQWALAPRIERACGDGFLWTDLTEPHHEHWMPVPMAIMLSLASWTDWNCRAELLVNGLLGLGILSVFAWRTMQVQRERGSRSVLALPTVALLALSVTQHQNWLWGLQISSLLCVLASLTSLHLICSANPTTMRLIAAITSGIIASCSQFHGNLVWPIGIVGIVLSHGNLRNAARPMIAWTVIATLVAANAYDLLETDADTMAPLQAPLRALDYVFTYLGSPIAGQSQLASHLSGIIGCLAAGALLIRSNTPRAKPFLVALLLLSLGAAAITAIGRMNHSLDDARAGRYISYATPLWVAVSLLLASSNLHARLRSTCLALIYAAVCWQGIGAWHDASNQSALRQAARDHFVAQRDAIPADVNAFSPVFADPELLALLQRAAPQTDPAHFYIEYQDEIQQLLVRYGLSFVDPLYLTVMHRNHQLVRNCLIALKQRRLSIFRDQ